MSELHLHGHVEQRFPLEQPPGLAFRYFADNEDLLRQFLGQDRVEALGDGVYRLRLNPHGALGLTLRPSFDVKFEAQPPDRVAMRSLAARLAESSHADAGFDAHFTGEARFLPSGDGTEMSCWAKMEVTLALPAVLAWMPTGPLEALGNGIIHPAMAALAHRLVPIMQRDIHRWVAGQSPIAGQET